MACVDDGAHRNLVPAQPVDNPSAYAEPTHRCSLPAHKHVDEGIDSGDVDVLAAGMSHAMQDSEGHGRCAERRKQQQAQIQQLQQRIQEARSRARQALSRQQRLRQERATLECSLRCMACAEQQPTNCHSHGNSGVYANSPRCSVSGGVRQSSAPVAATPRVRCSCHAHRDCDACGGTIATAIPAPGYSAHASPTDATLQGISPNVDDVAAEQSVAAPAADSAASHACPLSPSASSTAFQAASQLVHRPTSDQASLTRWPWQLERSADVNHPVFDFPHAPISDFKHCPVITYDKIASRMLPRHAWRTCRFSVLLAAITEFQELVYSALATTANEVCWFFLWRLPGIQLASSTKFRSPECSLSLSLYLAVTTLESLFLVLEHELLCASSDPSCHPPPHPAIESTEALDLHAPEEPGPELLARLYARVCVNERVPLAEAVDKALRGMLLRFRRRLPFAQWRRVCMRFMHMSRGTLQSLRARASAQGATQGPPSGVSGEEASKRWQPDAGMSWLLLDVGMVALVQQMICVTYRTVKQGAPQGEGAAESRSLAQVRARMHEIVGDVGLMHHIGMLQEPLIGRQMHLHYARGTVRNLVKGERQQHKLYKQLRLTQEQKERLAERWRSWCRRRTALSHQLHTALSLLTSFTTSTHTVPLDVWQLITAAAGAPEAHMTVSSSSSAVNMDTSGAPDLDLDTSAAEGQNNSPGADAPCEAVSPVADTFNADAEVPVLEGCSARAQAQHGMPGSQCGAQAAEDGPVTRCSCVQPPIQRVDHIKACVEQGDEEAGEALLCMIADPRVRQVLGPSTQMPPAHDSQHSKHMFHSPCEGRKSGGDAAQASCSDGQACGQPLCGSRCAAESESERSHTTATHNAAVSSEHEAEQLSAAFLGQSAAAVVVVGRMMEDVNGAHRSDSLMHFEGFYPFWELTEVQHAQLIAADMELGITCPDMLHLCRCATYELNYEALFAETAACAV